MDLQKLHLKHQQVGNHCGVLTQSTHTHLEDMLPISSGTAGASDIEPFDYSQYANEDAGTPDFAVYHQKQLQSCGLHMGHDGYEVSDLHETPLYRVQIGDKRYSGGVDGGVIPYAVLPESAAKLLRIGFVHKQSSQDKATFCKNNPDVLQVRNPSVCASPHVAVHLCDAFALLCILTSACRLKLVPPGSTHSRKAEVRLSAVCWLRMQCASSP